VKLVTHYSSPKDAKREHPALNLDAAMHKEDFADISGSYNFPEVDLWA